MFWRVYEISCLRKVIRKHCWQKDARHCFLLLWKQHKISFVRGKNLSLKCHFQQLFFVWVAFEIAKRCVDIAHNNRSTWVGLTMMMLAMVQTPCLDKTLSTACLDVKKRNTCNCSQTMQKSISFAIDAKHHITHVCISMCSLSWAHYKRLIVVLVGSSIWSVKSRGLVSGSCNLDLNQHPFVGSVFKERDYGMVVTSFGFVWHIVQIPTHQFKA